MSSPDNAAMVFRALCVLIIPFVVVGVSACSVIPALLISKATGRESYRESSEAMMPTLKEGAVVTGTVTDGTYTPKTGDVIAFLPPKSWGGSGGYMIKRIIGVPGSTVSCCDPQHRMVIDGKPVDEPYVTNERASQLIFEPIVVPEGRIWVQGDNRDVSLDSRNHHSVGVDGTVPVSNVIGVIDVSTAK
ncbi:signal peptidase I [Streptosporangium sp. NPDC049078]|uniref:signal peptidase I n=1 Tax=Streptosporangium sp. NPDC049078 TaxID=3155767 RepID=UPI00343D547B